MIYTEPDYYKEFTCIADKCEDTCCAGWQIVIDEASLDRYKQEKGQFQKRLKQGIDWKQGIFKQKEEKRCAFLNEENLCEMYRNLGEDSLCDTCKHYPRHMEEFENVREYSLSVSCPEVARILLNKKEPVTFVEREVEGYEEFEDYDPFLFSILEDGREVIQKILQNRSLDISFRAALVWQLSDEMQTCIDEESLFSCEDILDKYKRGLQGDELWQGELLSGIKHQLEQYHQDENRRYTYAVEMFQKLYRLELISEEWEYQLLETETLLYRKGAKAYQKMKQDFAAWLLLHMPDWPVMAEQLLVYFIHTYFCGAVYDGMAATKTRMSVISVHYIHEMMMARWQKNEGILDMEDVISIVYRYSRELEHSDLNLELMEELLENG